MVSLRDAAAGSCDVAVNVVSHSAQPAVGFVVAAWPRGTPSRRLALLFAWKSARWILTRRDRCARVKRVRASETSSPSPSPPSFVCPIAGLIQIRPSVPLPPPFPPFFKSRFFQRLSRFFFRTASRQGKLANLCSASWKTTPADDGEMS